MASLKFESDKCDIAFVVQAVRVCAMDSDTCK